MKLRRPCEHGRYDEHPLNGDWLPSPFYALCPGGEFLADDALVIEKVNIDRDLLAGALGPPRLFGTFSEPQAEIRRAARLVLDALTVREGA